MVMEVSESEGDESNELTTCEREEERLAFLPRMVCTTQQLVSVSTSSKGRVLLDVHPDSGERAWPRRGYVLGVSEGAGVDGGAGGIGVCGRVALVASILMAVY
jgi:hypothetical protein